MGRFICSDSIVATCQGFSGYNSFAYCGNSPVVRRDVDGNTPETIWDLISLGASLAEVAANPTDPWAWASLIGDAIDAAVPFLGGTGEVIRGFKAVANAIHAAESANALNQFTQTSIDAITEMTSNLPKGDTCVYVSFKDNTLEYVGITNDFGRRKNEWKGTRDIHQITKYIDRTQARCVEQLVISCFGKDENGVLSNIRNSIGIKGSKIGEYEKFFRKIVKQLS